MPRSGPQAGRGMALCGTTRAPARGQTTLPFTNCYCNGCSPKINAARARHNTSTAREKNRMLCFIKGPNNQPSKNSRMLCFGKSLRLSHCPECPALESTSDGATACKAQHSTRMLCLFPPVWRPSCASESEVILWSPPRSRCQPE